MGTFFIYFSEYFRFSLKFNLPEAILKATAPATPLMEAHPGGFFYA